MLPGRDLDDQGLLQVSLHFFWSLTQKASSWKQAMMITNLQFTRDDTKLVLALSTSNLHESEGENQFKKQTLLS